MIVLVPFSLEAAAPRHPSTGKWLCASGSDLARQAWMLGRGLQPLFSFSEGRTFRLALRLRRQIPAGDELKLGLVALVPAVLDGCGLC